MLYNIPTIRANLEGLREGHLAVFRHCPLDHLSTRLLVTDGARASHARVLLLHELRLTVEERLRNQQQLTDEGESQECEADPKDVAVAVSASYVRSANAPDERAGRQEEGVDGLDYVNITMRACTGGILTRARPR